MKQSRLNYFAVGLFTLVMLSGMVWTAAYLAGKSAGTRPYYTLYDNVTGIGFGTQVLFEGYPVGQVEGVSLHPPGEKKRFRVALAILETVSLPKDSVARVAISGLLSAPTITISAGSSRDMLAPGEAVGSAEQVDLFALVSDVAGELKTFSQGDGRKLFADFRSTLSNVSALLEGDGRALIENLKVVTDGLVGNAPGLMQDLQGVTARLSAVMARVEGLLSPDNVAGIERTIQQLDEASRNMAMLSRDLAATRESLDKFLAGADGLLSETGQVVSEGGRDVKRTLTDLRYVLDSVSRHIDNINLQLENTSRNMSEFSRRIRENPGLLLGIMGQGTPAPQEERR